MSLTRDQQAVAATIYGLALKAGLPPARARELVAAAYAESTLNPRATNKSSGAAGLFQLLSSGYRQKAQQLGGLYDVTANTQAILPNYVSYWKSHPHARPGEAARDVELSGEGAGFYSRPLALIGDLGGVPPAPGGRIPPTSPPAYSMGGGGMSPGRAPIRPLTEGELARVNAGFRVGGGVASVPIGGHRLTMPEFFQPPPRPAPLPQQPAQAPTRQPYNGGGYPLGKRGKIIGTPFSGTHTLGNWESDNAVDLAVPVGTPVYALEDGVVGSQIGALDSSNPRMAGLRVHVDGPVDSFYYAHLSRLAVRAGQRVKKGQLIGYSGSANGTAHLHFASRNRDPRSYVGV